MRNVITKTEGNKLIIEVDLGARGQPSASGKTIVIASTEGNAKIGDVMVGLNVYRKPDAAAAA